MPAFLPYGRQTIEDDDVEAVAAALRSDYLTTGPLVEDFEKAFAKTVNARHAVVCSNGTAALHLSMMALNVGPGDAIVVPSITFLATANCARFVGADVIFADVDPMSGLMTPETLEAAISRANGRNIAAVLPVHLRGDVCDTPEIKAIADMFDAPVVEDACHALGSASDFGADPDPVGNCRNSAMACFSFHPVKTIATAEGGMVTTNDDELAERLRRFRGHGMIRPLGADPWVYEMPEVGYNYRLPDVLCALGISQLAKLGRFAQRRRELAARYAQGLAGLNHVQLATTPDWSRPTLHLLTALIDFGAIGKSRAQVVAELKRADVGTQVHYIPVHTQPYYRVLNPTLSLPGAEAWYARCLSLPLYPGMEDADVDRVVEALTRAVSV